jgi:hypothetical protein
MVTAILSLLCGMVLGQRFKMLILAPFSLLMLLVGIAMSLTHAATPQGLALNIVAPIVCLQCGYLLGLGIRQLSVLARAKQAPAASVVSSLPVRRSAH